jgi:ferredoxin
VDAPPTEVKRAYYRMQKICHPDVAGQDGEEMSILLNSAYDVLASESGRAAYNQQLKQRAQVPDPLAMARRAAESSRDMGPTWKWAPKRHKQRPVWNGMPRSRSVWNRVPTDGRGEKHAQQMFAFVDEWSCICCRNCCDAAPHTFCIDIESGRARVFAQWGDTEQDLTYAMAACPVDCIYWVSREDLQRLEFVTADTIYDKGPASLPCPMAVRQGTYTGEVDDPWYMADEFRKKQKQREERARSFLSDPSATDAFAGRIGDAVGRLPPGLLKRLYEVWGL